MGKKYSKKKDYSYKNICTKMIILTYLIAIFGIYPICMDNMYFNITITRANFFINSTIVFLVCYIVGYLIDKCLDQNFDMKIEYEFKKQNKYYSMPSFWMEMFLLANVFAWYHATDSADAFSGKAGRYMGLCMYLIIALMFVFICLRIDLNNVPLVVFGIVTLYIYLFGIIQHLELDILHCELCHEDCMWNILHYRETLGEKQFDIFMSTMGNINIYASFIVISLSVFFALFVFAEKNYMKLISSCVLILGGSCVMISNSDSGYLGVVAAAYILFLLAYKWGKTTEYTLGLVLLGIGNMIVVIMNKTIVGKYDQRGGVADALDSVGVSLIVLIVLIIIYVGTIYISKKHKEIFQTRNKNKDIVGIIIGTVIVGIITIIVGNAKGADIFTFNYKWGTYRGFTWTKCVELYGELPVANKLFGIGNDGLAEYLNAFCKDEMLEVTGKLYDNAHNELLQYLLTLGIFGLVTYLCIFVSSFVYILRYGKGNVYAVMALTCMTGYFAQSLINLNQPITTPMYFIIMAVGVGYVTHLREKQERDGVNC